MITRLQAYLRASAAYHYRAFPVPPFTGFLHPTDPFPFFNYAVPDEPVHSGNAPAVGALASLVDLFRNENRVPRFEFVGEYAPELPALLERGGFVLESRLPLLLCTLESIRPPTVPAGFAVTVLDQRSPRELLIAHSRIAFTAFTPGTEWDPSAEGAIPAEKAAAAAKGAGLFVGSFHGQPVTVATYSPPHDGITELTGIATLREYRGRGFAGAITALATDYALLRGVSVAMLSAGDEGAGRVYERVGYARGATAVAYRYGS